MNKLKYLFKITLVNNRIKIRERISLDRAVTKSNKAVTLSAYILRKKKYERGKREREGEEEEGKGRKEGRHMKL